MVCGFRGGLFARDDDVQRMDHSHGPHDCKDWQAQAAKAEQPEDQIQPKGTGLNSHLGGHSQRRQEERQDDAQEIGKHDREGFVPALAGLRRPCCGSGSGPLME